MMFKVIGLLLLLNVMNLFFTFFIVISIILLTNNNNNNNNNNKGKKKYVAYKFNAAYLSASISFNIVIIINLVIHQVSMICSIVGVLISSSK
jgi:hypothetical protein